MKKNLENLLENILSEDVPPPQPTSTQDFAPVESQAVKNTSLDQTVDRYLVRYEREAVPMSNVYESVEGLTSFLLKEQEDEDLDLGGEEEEAPADDAGGDELGGDLGGDDPLGDLGGGAEDPAAPGGGEAAPAPAASATPRLNVNDFARAVARLVNNFEALLDPKSTILNRAEAYIASNYDQRTAEELMQILEVNYSLTPVETANTATPEEEFPTPYTAGAWGGEGG